MKQGRASSSGPGQRKVEPDSMKVGIVPVSRLGAMQGSHSMDSGGKTLRNSSGPLYPGKGYEAPKAASCTHKGGSQGKY